MNIFHILKYNYIIYVNLFNILYKLTKDIYNELYVILTIQKIIILFTTIHCSTFAFTI